MSEDGLLGSGESDTYTESATLWPFVGVSRTHRPCVGAAAGVEGRRMPFACGTALDVALACRMDSRTRQEPSDTFPARSFRSHEGRVRAVEHVDLALSPESSQPPFSAECTCSPHCSLSSHLEGGSVPADPTLHFRSLGASAAFSPPPPPSLAGSSGILQEVLSSVHSRARFFGERRCCPSKGLVVETVRGAPCLFLDLLQRPHTPS